MNRKLETAVFIFSVVLIIFVMSTSVWCQPVEVVSEYKLTSSDLEEMTARFGVAILAGYNNVYRCQGFQYQINFMKCARENVNELAGLMQQIAPRSTLARTEDGVFEIITVDQYLARNVLLNLEGVSILEKGKLIPLQLPLGWLVTAESFTGSEDLAILNKSHQGGILEVFNQMIRTGASERLQVNYILCKDLGSAERVFALRFAAAKHPRSVKRIGKLVIEVVATDPEIVNQVIQYFE